MQLERLWQQASVAYNYLFQVYQNRGCLTPQEANYANQITEYIIRYSDIFMIISELYNKLKNSPLLANTFKLSTSNVIALFSVVVLTPIISRLYTPEIYGEWGVFSNVLMICTCLLFLTYDYSIIQSEDRNERINLTWLCMLIAIIISVVVYFVFTIGKYFGITFFSTFPALELLIIILILTAVYNLLYALTNRASLYNIIAAITVIVGLAQPLLRILLGYVHMTRFSLIYANLITQILGIICFVFYLRKHYSIDYFRKFDLKQLIPLAKKYKKYPLYDAPSYVIETLCSCIVIIILSNYYLKDEIGCYSMIMQLIVLPVTMVGSAMSKVFFRDLSSVKEDEEGTRALVIKTAKLAFLLSLIPIVGFSLGGDKLVALFLGSKWTYASDMTLCLAVYSMPIILTEPLLPIFRSKNRQEVRFKFNVANLLMTTFTLSVGIIFFKHILLVLLLYSFGNAIMRFLLLKTELKQVRLNLGDIFPNSLLVVALCYVVLGIRLFFVLL